MRRLLSPLLLGAAALAVVTPGPACAQRAPAADATPEARFRTADLAAHLRFLASDFPRALAPFGLTPLADPAPEQGLFDRSDNVALAAKGIPAPTFSPGFRAFTDPGVADFYHRVADEADERYPFTYLRKFAQAYTRTARLIADAPTRPRWTPGDRYEAAARALYGAAY